MSPLTLDDAPTSVDDIPVTRPRRGQALRRTLAVLVAAIVVTTGLVATLRLVHRGEALPGVHVAGIEVGGRSPDDIRATIADTIVARSSETVTLRRGRRSLTYRPAPATAQRDVDAAGRAALAHGRDGGLLDDAWAHVVSLWRQPVEVDYTTDAHADAVASWLDAVAGDIDHPPFDGSIEIDPASLAVRVVEPRGGIRVDRSAATATVLSAMRTPGEEVADLPVIEIPQAVPAAAVEAVGRQAEAVLSAPTELVAGPRRVVVEPAEFAPLLGAYATADRTSAELILHDGPFEEFRRTHLAALEVPAVEARFTPSTPPVTFDEKGDASWSPRPVDIAIDPPVAGTALRGDPREFLLDELRRGSHTVRFGTVVDEPEFTLAEAEALGVNRLIGTFTSHHACCQNRVHNIHLIADLVDGAILAPGASFSINDHVGERTTAGGFLEDGTIVDGEFVPTVGGGISQFATTLYNAAFFAGIEVEEHKAHSYYLERYPMGREATLAWPSVDLVIRNDTDHGVVIRTSYTDTSVTVALYGDNGDLRVRADVGTPTDRRTSETVYRDDPTLRPGEERELQAGGTGFDIVVRRIIELDGDVREEELRTRYLAPTRIVARGVVPEQPS